MISDVMDKAYFPIQLHEMKAKMRFHALKEESMDIFDATLTSCFVNHASNALGYRLSVAGRSVVYIGDNEPFDREVARAVKNVDKAAVEQFATQKGDPNQRIFDFAREADVLIHDATYTPEEYVDHVGWGHSHYLFSLNVAHEARVRKLVLFHHDQTHTDDEIDEIVRRCRREVRTRSYRFECVAAAEGMEIDW